MTDECRWCLRSDPTVLEREKLLFLIMIAMELQIYHWLVFLDYGPHVVWAFRYGVTSPFKNFFLQIWFQLKWRTITVISFHLLCPHKLYIKILFHGSYTFDLENYLLWDLIMHIPHFKNLNLFFYFWVRFVWSCRSKGKAGCQWVVWRAIWFSICRYRSQLTQKCL